MYVSSLITEFNIEQHEEAAEISRHPYVYKTTDTGTYIYIHIHINRITGDGIMSAGDTIAISEIKTHDPDKTITQVYSCLPSLNGFITEAKFKFIQRLLTEKQVTYTNGNCTTYIAVHEHPKTEEKGESV